MIFQEKFSIFARYNI